jgi:hypothetical protein
MKEHSPRLCIPIDKHRPRGARLIDGYSPKLGRDFWVGRASAEEFLFLPAGDTSLPLLDGRAGLDLLRVRVLHPN